jgi:hypothetical protein
VFQGRLTAPLNNTYTVAEAAAACDDPSRRRDMKKNTNGVSRFDQTPACAQKARTSLTPSNRTTEAANA